MRKKYNINIILYKYNILQQSLHTVKYIIITSLYKRYFTITICLLDLCVYMSVTPSVCMSIYLSRSLRYLSLPVYNQPKPVQEVQHTVVLLKILKLSDT